MPDHQPVEKIHLVFKTHLDLGFTDLAKTVYRRYMDDFIPAALRLARSLRQSSRDERFVWTTGSWLINEFLEHGSVADRQRMEEAIVAGDIVWHALPFTTHTELMSPDLFRFGLGISQRLDARFGRKTIAAKMTDVPGHTRGIVPLLAETGVKLLHIGVNEASAMPDVPQVFIWRDEASGHELLVVYEGDYGGLVRFEGLREALLLRMTGDNIGPPSLEAVRGAYLAVRQRFPEATLIPSTLDQFAAALDHVRDQLPVVTSEVGDTWIHGVGTDPQKVRSLRELMRLERSVAENDSVPEHARSAFQNGLLCAVEHTWGLDVKTHLRDFHSWTATEFAAARRSAPFQAMEASWVEQRAYMDSSVAALVGTRWHAPGLEALAPASPATAPLGEPTTARQFTTRHFELTLDESTGAISHLRTLADNREWASPTHLLALFRYETFDESSYKRFWAEYIRNKDRADVVEWAQFDYTKPNIAGKSTRIEPTSAKLESLDAYAEPGRLTLTAILKPPAEWTSTYGAPPLLHLKYVMTDQPAQIQIALSWYGKPACRLPEALWLSFVPNAPGARWCFEKLGAWIDPLDVVTGGNRNLHAVSDRVVCAHGKRALTLTTLDAPLVAPGAPALLRFNRTLPDMNDGVHVNLFNNVWGTNFPMWNDGDGTFRFQLRWDSADGLTG
ncbi:MAG TPA: DUF5054 domain-containing protein [Candidatus Limnocylindrales bacterium]|nr:DUF5054 domain-containing protein [Candidatus Limnocylindrales bacterium]